MNNKKQLYFMTLIMLVTSVCLCFTACKNTAKAKHTLTFKNGGQNYEMTLVDDGETATLPQDPVRNGYAFGGWYVDDGVWENRFTADEKIDKDVTVYAKWALVNYSITYRDPEGKDLSLDGFDLPTSYTIESEKIILNDYYADGQTFYGWTDEDGDLVRYIKKGSFGNLVLYANFDPLPLLEINYDDPFDRPNENQTTAQYGETVNLLPLKKADYDFIGWTLNGDDIIDSVEVFSSITLLAVWERKAGLEDFDYVVDDEYVGYNQDGFIMLLDVLDPSVTELVIPDCVSMIRSGLLRNCSSLESLTLPFLGESTQANAATSHLAFLFGGNSYGENATCVPQSLKTLVINGGEIADYALFGCAYIEKLIFNDGVTRIGDSAAGKCSGLKELQVPFIGEKYCEDDDYNGISKTFPDNARPVYIFGGRNKTEQYPKALEKLTITKGYAPDPTYYIGREKNTRFYTLSQLPKLKEIDYTSANDYLYDHMFEVIGYLEKLTIRGNVKKIGFFFGYTYYADNIKELIIPDTVTEISEQSFMSFKSLPKISLPNVRAIPARAFVDCERLNSIELCSELTSIGNEAFSGCSSLFSLTVPKTVTEIGVDAFKDCTNLFEVYNLSSLKAEKGSDDLGGLCKNAWEVYSSENDASKFENINGCIVYEKDGEKLLMKYIGNSANVDIPDGVTVIYANAFTDCTAITSVTIPESVTTIRNNAFDSCSNLVSVEMTDSVVNIGNNIFINCKSLSSVELPSSIDIIPEGMFEGCSNLSAINIPSNVQTIGKRAFYGTGLNVMNFDNVVNINESAFENTAFDKISLPDSLKSIGNYSFRGCVGLTAVTFGSGLETIGDEAFSGCVKLNGIVLPESLTALGGKAFYECSSLTSVVIPSKITVINTYTFGMCTSLSDVTLNDNLVEIGYAAFFKTNLKELKWPSKLEIISESAFRYTHFEKVVLPDSVKRIGGQAFGDIDELTELIVSEHTEEIASDIASCSFNITKLAVPYVGRVCDIMADSGKPYKLTTLIIYGGDIIRRQRDYYYNDSSTFGHPDTRNSVNYFQSLTSLTLGKNVKSIDDGSLFNLPSLKTLILPNASFSTGLNKLFGEETKLFDTLGFLSGDVSAEYLTGISAAKWLLNKDVTNPGIPAGSTVLFTGGTYREWEASSFENKNNFNVYYYSQESKIGGTPSWRYTFNGLASPEIW